MSDCSNQAALTTDLLSETNKTSPIETKADTVISHQCGRHISKVCFIQKTGRASYRLTCHGLPANTRQKILSQDKVTKFSVEHDGRHPKEN